VRSSPAPLPIHIRSYSISTNQQPATTIHHSIFSSHYSYSSTQISF
jgi:hypothetical protein